MAHLLEEVGWPHDISIYLSIYLSISIYIYLYLLLHTHKYIELILSVCVLCGSPVWPSSGGGSSVGPSPLCWSPVWVPCVGPLCGSPVWVPCWVPRPVAPRCCGIYSRDVSRSFTPPALIQGIEIKRYGMAQLVE